MNRGDSDMTYKNPYMGEQTWPEVNILETLRQRILLLCVLPMMWCGPLRLMVY